MSSLPDFRNKPEVRLRVKCPCGNWCEVIPDAKDPMRFHYECHQCGNADAIIATGEWTAAENEV